MFEFKRWCREQKFNNGANLSHVLMDGGVLSVPFDRLDDFYDKYVEAVKASEKVYVVEQKTERYNFFYRLQRRSRAHGRGGRYVALYATRYPVWG